MGSRCEVKNIDKVLYLSGRIDETFHEAIITTPDSGEVSFNLKGIVSINSTGIRAWILLMRKMQGAIIYFYECPRIFIDQANMVKGVLTENAKIMSFYVPYYNDKNGTEKNILFVLNHQYTANKLMPLEKVLDEKGDEMEMDVLESKYFKFIKDVLR